jgi:hypothetical protein
LIKSVVLGARRNKYSWATRSVMWKVNVSFRMNLTHFER